MRWPRLEIAGLLIVAAAAASAKDENRVPLDAAIRWGGEPLDASHEEGKPPDAPHVVALEREVALLRKQLQSSAWASRTARQMARQLGGGESHEEHKSHQHDALLYLVIMLVVGTMILHLTTHPKFHSLPYTVVLFVLGGMCSLLYHVLGGSARSWGVLGRSYEMWMKIDPHLLIFTMLPVLLTGDAMTIDVAVAKRVAGQCLWLAGPGVLISAFLTAAFLHLYFQWEFMLCLVVGAILAATDPVAVVGLLKELGASPTLTVQIQGESLLNDGTAMVLFLVAYNMLGGEEYDVKGVCVFLFYMVCGSWFFGTVIGAIFSSWIRSAGNRLEHHSSQIQISLTLCCAYGSFVFAEGVIGLSGVLANVAASLVLADTIWPKIVSKEAMHEVWHTIEYLGNTAIFFLAGALTGRIMMHVDLVDYLHLLLIYIVVMAIRGAVLFTSRPLLTFLSPDRTPVTMAEAAVMTWGGLRGAVGLALAIQVNVDRAGGALEQHVADRVLFFTGGIAMLTLLLNATTCPALVNKLGITSTTSSRAKVMMQIHRRLVELNSQGGPMASKVVLRLLEDVEHHVHKACPGSKHHPPQREEASLSAPAKSTCLSDYRAAKRAFERVDDKTKELLGWDKDNPLIGQEAALLSTAVAPVDIEVVRVISEAFLGMVRSQHWAQIERGEFVRGSSAAEMLLSANTKAFQLAIGGVKDFPWLIKGLGISASITPDSPVNDMMTSQSSSQSNKFRRSATDASLSSAGFTRVNVDSPFKGACARIIKSLVFQGSIVMLIVVNSALIFMDPGPESDDAVMWVVVDCLFQVCYIAELILKFIVLRLGFFSDAWNCLDFMCVVLGLFGNVISVIVAVGFVSSSAISNEMLLIRLGRVFKLIRLLRLVAIIKFGRKLHAKYRKKTVSDKLASKLEIIGTLRAFVQAHVLSHRVLLKFFGKQRSDFSECMSSVQDAFNRQISVDSFAKQISQEGVTSLLMEPEEAKCVVESFAAVYNAIILGSIIIARIEGEANWMLESMVTLRESCILTEDHINFVVSAIEAGVLKEKDAEILIHPLTEHLKKAGTLFSDTHAGIHRNSMKRFSTYDQAKLESLDLSVEAEGISSENINNNNNLGEEEDFFEDKEVELQV